MKFRGVRLTIMICCAAIPCLPACPAPASAAGVTGKGTVAQPGKATEKGNDRPAADARAHASSSRERRSGRQARFIQNTIDDLNYIVSITREDIERLSRLLDAITLLEPPKREYDIRNMLNWYYGCSDWNKEMVAEYQDRLDSLALSPRDGENLNTLYADLARKNSDVERQLRVMIERYEAQLERLFRIIERRQYLNDRLLSLQEQLSAIEEKIRRQKPQTPERTINETRADQIRGQIRVVQTDLISLYDIKEELLKHYALIIEMGRDETFWLDLKKGEYDLLRNASKALGMSGSKYPHELEQTYRGLIRGYEAEIRRINRRIEELDRKRSNVPPAGSIRDLDRSRDLSDFFLDRQQRYSDYINRLKTRIGSLDTELSEITSRPRSINE